MSSPTEPPTPLSDTLADAVGRVLSGKFQVERLLGQGGMGAVYVATHVFTKRKGALKLLHRRYAENAAVVERFVREASAAGVIENPHVVHTYDAGILDTGEPYMFMELLAGEPLDALLARRGPLALAEACELVAQAAEGLAAAHAADIVHRDIKPANLFVEARDRPFVKLLDFGISKFASLGSGDMALTSEGDLLGTPLYMSPEQLTGQLDIDGRTDIFSLGAVLYELLCGTAPFAAGSMVEIGMRVTQGDYAPMGERRSDTPAELDALFAQLFANDRERRPSATALQNVLRGIVEAEGSERGEHAASEMEGAQPPGRSRRKLGYVALAGLLLLLATALAWVLRGDGPQAEADEALPGPLAEEGKAAPEASNVDSQVDEAPVATAEEAAGTEEADAPASVTQAATQPAETVAAEPGPRTSRAKHPAHEAPATRKPASAAARDGLAQDNPFAK